MSSTGEQIRVLFAVLDAADGTDLPVWLESGWAIDARLGRVTRDHDDIDLAVPAERMHEFQALLDALGAGSRESMDYGFLVRVDDVLLDCEACHPAGGGYELEGAPPGSCPPDPEGILAGRAVRCTSWPAIAWEYFHYLDEVPFEHWPAKDVSSYALVRHVLGEREVDALLTRFRASRHGEP
jgi:aminoglycoside 2''-adenylyltransferase